MSWSNYHSHCHYCDGQESPLDFFNAAKGLKMRVAGFSSHAPLPFETGWNMPGNKLASYLAEIEQIKLTAQDGPVVLKSLEVDYIPGIMGPLNNVIQEAKLDYIIGSVHFAGKYNDGSFWSIDHTPGEFNRGLDEIYDGNVKAAVTNYFHIQNLMLEKETPSIIGHLDKIRMHNADGIYFNESAGWYMQLVRDTMSLAVEKGVIVEVNTKYFNRGGMLFPSSEHFKWMAKNNVRVILSSDAHRPGSLTRGFPESAAMLQAAGVKFLWEWEGGGFVQKSYDTKGIND